MQSLHRCLPHQQVCTNCPSCKRRMDVTKSTDLSLSTSRRQGSWQNSGRLLSARLPVLLFRRSLEWARSGYKKQNAKRSVLAQVPGWIFQQKKIIAASETSQIGPFFFESSNLTLLLVDSDDEAAVLPPDQDAGVRDENMQCAHTWLVLAKARLAPAKSWKDVFDSRKKRQNKCLGVASVITFASSDIDGLILTSLPKTRSSIFGMIFGISERLNLIKCGGKLAKEKETAGKAAAACLARPPKFEILLSCSNRGRHVTAITMWAIMLQLESCSRCLQ